MRLRLLGKGLSKHKWAVDKGRGRFGSLLKYGRSWEERPRLNGIQYGTQPVTCNAEDNGSAVAYMILKRSHTNSLVSLMPHTSTLTGSNGVCEWVSWTNVRGIRNGTGEPWVRFSWNLISGTSTWSQIKHWQTKPMLCFHPFYSATLEFFFFVQIVFKY